MGKGLRIVLANSFLKGLLDKGVREFDYRGSLRYFDGNERRVEADITITDGDVLDFVRTVAHLYNIDFVNSLIITNDDIVLTFIDASVNDGELHLNLRIKERSDVLIFDGDECKVRDVLVDIIKGSKLNDLFDEGIRDFTYSGKVLSYVIADRKFESSIQLTEDEVISIAEKIAILYGEEFHDVNPLVRIGAKDVGLIAMMQPVHNDVYMSLDLRF